METRLRKLDDEKRAALIEAAMEEIAANGIEGASYNRIIERSGLSKGAVYYYFENKESLYGTVLEEVEQKFISSVGRLKMPETAGEFWPSCRLYYEKAVRFGFENLDMVKVVRSLLEPLPGTGETARFTGISGRSTDGRPACLKGQGLGNRRTPGRSS